MRKFFEYNPIAITVCFAAILITVMFIQNPIIAATSLLGAVLYYISVFRRVKLKTLCMWLIMFLLVTVLNPIFSRNGQTVLLFINGRAITLEALLYGANNALMILSVMIWFVSFSEIMTSDKVVYIFGKVSPRLALFLSMTLRYIPLYRRKAAEINNAQNAMGIYKEDNVIDNIKGAMKVFSALVTWSLETSGDTADSFYARGGELSGRSSFSMFVFRRSDGWLTVLSAVLFATIVVIHRLVFLSVDFYMLGNFGEKLGGIPMLVAYGAYLVLSVLPFGLTLRN